MNGAARVDKAVRADLICLLSAGWEIWMMVLACTLPLPAGYFMPAFIYGEGRGMIGIVGFFWGFFFTKL